jgi:hypothetical protein
MLRLCMRPALHTRRSTFVITLRAAGAGGLYISDSQVSGVHFGKKYRSASPSSPCAMRLQFEIVRRVTSSGTITTVAGSRVRGYNGNGGLATAARLSGVSSVAPDGLGGLFITGTFPRRITIFDALYFLLLTVSHSLCDPARIACRTNQ